MNPIAPAVESLEQAVEQGRAVEKEAGISDCSVEEEGQGSWRDFAVVAR